MKKINKEFIIPIKGLSLGEHHYDFVVRDAFFGQFAFQDIHHGELKLSLTIEKEPGLMILLFRFDGSLQLICDRCLDEYSQPLRDDFRLIVKYGEKEEEVSEELITIPFEESHLDLRMYIYEFIQLMVPMKRVHPDDKNGNNTCNAEMIKKLETFGEYETYPRWAAVNNPRGKPRGIYTQRD